MERIFVIPKSGARVVDPATREALPAAGKSVERNKYWMRRELDGDVTLGKEPAAPSKSTSKKD